MKKLAGISLVFYFFLFVLPRFCYEKTGDFWYQTILSDLPFNPRWEAERISSAEMEMIPSLLNQRFFFLGSGMQCFAFLGEDEKTVLKFFKHSPSLLKKGRFLWHRPFLDSIFDSYKLAFQELKEETGILFLHLNKTRSLLPTVTLIDKMGNPHQIALDETEFVLQKAGELICKRLRRQMEDQDISGAKRSLDTLFFALSRGYRKGIKNNDRAFRRNVGFSGDHALLLDAGSLLCDERVKIPMEAQKEVLQKGRNLQNWLLKHYPELHVYYMNLVQQMKEE
ncbi:MAG: hypothetical protein A3G30_02345 [Chlamydiae bacterium RIFCSPLOWO2_12_FULL_49_12]|nr:MAG: hypothetical protein A2098_04760 [Chlamydiae bacterium GWF2_49_8]OGN58136.1 MAG: hypothetical protein A3D18_05820 [Chlamydiae bacterium RIFCSPHIGHO2_02_FULL_49_29]OGN64638.1 MAG: hypothetical protein A3E26_05740 [Chlamydiae bacterium RIFCSPHIGHO2_12_FULL_49_32]OGN69428.1 MAG: hypothetical protein A3I15_06115 [Chlamydiae bacterium RIFCSPLOWO2_02_FULL_49_12]OGN75461.1 MAG: hypothetical protein A3G30_02345 [Chlamydiae bacterium RIFCSPLOWO2_12_FULL_49_12]HCJ83575.1 hypothetical protein [Pa